MSVDIQRMLSLGKDERKEEALESMRASVRSSVEHIAVCRRSSELTYDLTNEEFDKMLNEMCEEAQSKFGSMTESELAMHMLSELMRELVG